MKHFLLIVLCVGGLYGQTYASQLDSEERVASWVLLGDKPEGFDYELIEKSPAQSRVQSPVRDLVKTPPPPPFDQDKQQILIFDNPAYNPEVINTENTEFITVEQNEAGDSQVVENKKKENVVYDQPKELDLGKMVRSLSLKNKADKEEEQLVQCLQKEYLKQVGTYITKEVKQSANSVVNYVLNNDPEEAFIQGVGYLIKSAQDFFYPEL